MDEVKGFVFFGVYVNCPKCDTIFDLVNDIDGDQDGTLGLVVINSANWQDLNFVYHCVRCNSKLILTELEY